jgi:hypothetical protein
VPALTPALAFDPAAAADLAGRSDVPLWLPAPVPVGWLLTGLRSARSPRQRACACAVGLSGHGLAAGPTDVVIVAEEPGCGLGASYAGLDQERTDPGPQVFDGASAVPLRTRTGTAAHLAALWSVPVGPDRCAFLGESGGAWLWLIGWPATAWALLEDGLRLADARADGAVREQPAGALNPRL